MLNRFHMFKITLSAKLRKASLGVIWPREREASHR